MTLQQIAAGYRQAAVPLRRRLRELRQALKTAEDPERDCYFYTGKSTAMSVRPGMFYIMFPSDGHKAGAHNEFPKHYRKVVVKIPVVE